MSSLNKTGYRYSISFSQSLSSGVIAFSGTVQFDEDKDGNVPNYHEELFALLQDTEEQFKNNGYRVASDIVPKEGKDKKEVKE